MSFNQPLPASREVSLHLWPGGPERQPNDWRGVQGVMMRRRGLLLGIFGAVLALCLLALWLMPPVYRANATLQVNTALPYTNENEMPVVADLTGENQGRSLVTQAEILQNDAVRERALSLLSSQDRAQVGAGSVSVKSVPETDLINVSASSRSPRAAAALANALCAAYMQLSRDKNRAQYGTARQYVGQQLAATRARLNGARLALRSYKQRNGTVDLATETQAQIGELARIQSEWRQARASRQAAQAQLSRLKSAASGLAPNVVTPGTIARRPEVVAMQARLTELELRRIEALEEYRPNSPQVQSLNGEIAALRVELRGQAQTEVQSWQQSPNPVRQQAEQTITQLQGDIWSLEARGIALKSLASRMQVDLNRLPAREQQLGQLTTDVAGLEQSYQTLNQKYQALRASEAARVASGSLLFAAKTPLLPTRRLTPLNIALCLMLASLLALGATALAERLDDRVRSPRDLPLVSDLPVLAQIPFIRRDGEQCLMDNTAMISPLLENFRTLRTMLSLSSNAQGSGSRSLAVTSSLPNEGKSLISVNLAVAAALGGERVILVDCDLRRPALHRLCGLHNDAGFINVANGELSLEAALQATRVPGLRVLTSGPVAANPFRALNSRGGRELLRQLSEMADFVIVDTPPVLVLADARVTATLAGSVLLVVSTREPEREEVALAGELLSQSGAQTAGIVLNKVAPGPGFRDYYSQYPYYTGSFTEGVNSAIAPRRAGGARAE